MKVTFILSDEFLRQFKRLAKKYSSLVNDYGILKKELCKNPFQGDDLGNGVSYLQIFHNVCKDMTVQEKT